METSILEEFEKEKVSLPRWYKIFAILRIVWVLLIIYGFIFAYIKLNIIIFKSEIIPLFLTLLPNSIYYLIQSKRELFLLLSSYKLNFLKVVSVILNFGLLYFAFHENLFQFIITSNFYYSLIPILLFYIFLLLISFIDLKYLFEKLLIYNKENLNKTI